MPPVIEHRDIMRKGRAIVGLGKIRYVAERMSANEGSEGEGHNGIRCTYLVPGANESACVKAGMKMLGVMLL